MALSADALYLSFTQNTMRSSLHRPRSTTGVTHHHYPETQPASRSLFRTTESHNRQYRHERAASTPTPLPPPYTRDPHIATLPVYEEEYVERELAPPPEYSAVCRGRRGSWYKKTLQKTQTTLSQLRESFSDAYWGRPLGHSYSPAVVNISRHRVSGNPGMYAYGFY